MLIGGSLGLSTINTFFEGTFSRAMGDNPNMVDQIFSVGVLAFILAIVILLKDIIDGGTFAPSERRSALLGFGLAGLLVLSALTMSMISSDTIQWENDDQLDVWKLTKETNTLYSHIELDSAVSISPVAVTSSPTTYYLRFYVNTTTLDSDWWNSLRGITFNVSQEVSGLTLKQSSGSVGLVDTITTSNGKSNINATVTSIDALYLVSNIDFAQDLWFEFSMPVSSYDNTVSTTIEYEFEIENDAELANFLIWAVMSFALYIPLMIYLDAFNNVRRFVNNPFDWGSRNRSTRGYRRMQRRMRR